MEKLIKENIIYDGKILKLHNDDVLCDNGIISNREIVDHSGGAGVLVISDNKVLLIKQYRYAYKEDLLEIPAGKLEDNEDPYYAALREVEEETGFKPSKITELGIIYPTCGYSNEKIYLYLATDFVHTKTNFDLDENITSCWYSLDEAFKMILDGTIKDAKTIIALYNYKERYLK